MRTDFIKKTPEQRLINLYKELLSWHLANVYTVHCTDSKRVVEASNKAMNTEYKESMKEFEDLLDDLNNSNFRCVVHGRVRPNIIRNPYDQDLSSWSVRCPQCSREVLKP